MSDLDAYCGDSPLWNLTLLLNSSWPRFTECFQSSILVYVPNGYLWCALVPYLPYLLFKRRGPPILATWSNATKTIISVILSLCTIIAILTEADLGGGPKIYPTAHYVARFVEGATYLLAAVLTQVERSCGVITSGVLFVYWLILTVVDIIPLYSYILLQYYKEDLGRVLVFYVSYVLIILQLLLQAFFADAPPEFANGACPETSATFLSRITYWWMSRLITTGFRRPLETADLWRLNPRDESSTVVPALERALTRAGAYSSYTDLSRANKDANSNSNNSSNSNNRDSSDETLPLLRSAERNGGTFCSMSRFHRERAPRSRMRCAPHYSLLRVLMRTYYGDVLCSYACKLCSDVLQYLSPLLLSFLITNIESPESEPWKGYVIAVLMLAVSWSQTAFYHQHFHIAMTTGMRMKTALMAAIYKKSLRLNTEGQRAATVGEVVNLMSVDCQRVQDMMSYTWMVWSIPFQVLIAVYLLWDTMGPSVLAGVGLLLLLVPVNGYLAYRQQALQKENLQWKDRRLKIMNEIISGIKVLKLYAWETSFQERVLGLRRKEIAVLTKLAHQNAISIFIWTCAPYLVTLATFATYVLRDVNARLDPNKAFVTLSLFNILQFPIAFVPEMISFTAQASVSIKRIDKFLKLGEIEPGVISSSNSSGQRQVRVERGLFTWDPNGRSTLHGINLDVSEGELVAVVGPVGSGKSSLLSALLGEMERRQGSVVVQGSVAYVPQQAWIQNATIRDNILFGREFRYKKYRKTIDACALAPDLDMLPGGDQTEIGEKGINLSGGQKLRVSLARAVYASRDIYLLDDPLAAVDSHVGKHIFTKVISGKGVLRKKTRVLVTHAVHWLPLVDTVVLMQEGRIVECGSYLQLMQRDGPLVQFLHSVLASASDDDVEEDPEVRELRRRMLEHVESATSASDGATSGDDKGLHADSYKLLSSVKRQELAKTAASEAQSQVAGARLTEEEQSATGRVQKKVVYAYARHLGRLAVLVIFMLFACYQVASVYANFWLTEWTADATLTSANVTESEVVERNHFYLLVYGLLGLAQAVFISLYAMLAAVRMVTAAANMHASILDCVLRSPISFFDTTPSGRIVNRFARDVETVDNTLPQILFMFIMCMFSVTSTLVVISLTTPLFAVVIIPLAAGYYALQRYFVPTSRQLKRLEAVTRSPIFSHFSETLSGVSLIRAYQATDRFILDSLHRIDKNQVYYFAGISANRWLGVWIEVVSSLVVLAATLFALLNPNITAGQAGLSITYALQITQALKWLVRTISDLETNIVSVERIHEYSELKPEAPRVTSVRPRMTWPSHGNVIFSKYSTLYRTGLDLVLKNIDLNIKAGEKVGIVGRTGAGKSSLTLALFRLIEPASGTITIDGVDVTSLGLYDLRSRLTVLPQDPVLFSGSLRMNLDPLGQFSERELWDSLQLAHLLPFVRELGQGLEYDCGEGGKNLSVGQRQLVCLARGLLRKTRILVLDEPTAAVDLATDLLIQATIRRDFKDATTITIAHRLNTIMDYDRVLVLDAGRIVEFDKPNTLLGNKDSVFYGLACDAGLVS